MEKQQRNNKKNREEINKSNQIKCNGIYVRRRKK